VNAAPGSVPPNVRTPEPKPAPASRPGAALPSRASFQLPGASETGPKSRPPAEPARTSLPKLPTRGAAVTEAAPTPPKAKAAAPFLEPVEDESPIAEEVVEGKAAFGAVGIIAAALLLMTAAYLGATMLMK
jgi:hypothetical protein